MKKFLFRDLRADEIECRVATARANGVSLLLYKDARCDQNILDETFGAFGWQRFHSRDNANCTVSIWDSEKNMWISKEDTGTESNTEKEKGLASDSFKRACFNWGIGRELYTAPFIWVDASDCKALKQDDRTKTYKCNDRFFVDSIEIVDKKIVGIVVKNANTNQAVFVLQKDSSNGSGHKQETRTQNQANGKKVSARDALIRKLRELNIDIHAFSDQHNLKGEKDPAVFERLLKELEAGQ